MGLVRVAVSSALGGGGEGGERGRGEERGKVQCPVSTVVQVSGYTVTECHICLVHI